MDINIIQQKKYFCTIFTKITQNLLHNFAFHISLFHYIHIQTGIWEKILDSKYYSTKEIFLYHFYKKNTQKLLYILHYTCLCFMFVVRLLRVFFLSNSSLNMDMMKSNVSRISRKPEKSYLVLLITYMYMTLQGIHAISTFLPL